MKVGTRGHLKRRSGVYVLDTGSIIGALARSFDHSVDDQNPK